ncbi:MAG: hypothetical protein HKN33_12280 [Pyrinomonadaceae bacterium]|nr:hypothetical protein [Pyrinomonadaceae bacterium]
MIKTLIIVIGVLTLVGIGGAVSQHGSGDALTTGPEDVVSEFWTLSAKGEEILQFFAEIPASFNDERPRCGRVSENENSGGKKLTETVGLAKGKMHKTEKFSEAIREKALVLVSVHAEREWNDEAVVWAKFHEPDKEHIQESHFFFMTRRNGNWHIFFDASILAIFNKEFGVYDCGEKKAENPDG